MCFYTNGYLFSKVNFGSANEIIVKNGRGNRKLRTINLENVQNVEIFTSSSSNILVFRCKKATYDLVSTVELQ